MKIKLYTILVLGALAFSNASCAGEDKTETSNTETIIESGEQEESLPQEVAATDANSETISTAPTVEGTVKVKMKTSMGDVTILLYDETPLHKNNFVKLVNEGFYDGLLFHRIIKDFMIQGGDPESKGAAAGVQLGGGGPGYTVPAEIQPKLYHKKGAICAARLGGPQNPLKASSGCQFYIVTGKVTPRTQLEGQSIQKNKQLEDQEIGKFLQDPANKAYADKMQVLQQAYQSGDDAAKVTAQADFDALIAEIRPVALKDFEPITYTEEQLKTYETIGGTPFLDNDYTVFGEVIEGLDIVDKMGLVSTAPGDRPTEDLKIISMTIIK